MTGLRFLLTCWVAKLTALGCRLCGYHGTSLPGVAALKLYPRVVEWLAPRYEQVVAVTGTNGKTTTANLLAHLLRRAGFTVAHNSEGANMCSGVAAALLGDCNWRGKPRSRFLLLEVDEGSVNKVFPDAQPSLVVVTNYFRDQLDRYHELEQTTRLLRSALADLSGAILLLNADDPLTAAIGRDFPNTLYYGVEWEKEPGRRCIGKAGANVSEETREGRYCAFCGEKLVYRHFYYSQLGDYFCPGCDFRRPEPDFAAICVEERDQLEFAVRIGSQLLRKTSARGKAGISTPDNQKMLRFIAPLRGFYNVYNILAATVAAWSIGVPLEAVRTSLLDYEPPTGRMQKFTLGRRQCTLVLIKNPVGVTQVLKTILATGTSKSLVLAINDLAADGRDISWLWDADFARLADRQVKKIVCAGLRAADLAVCLKYAGIPPEKLILTKDRLHSLRVLAEQEGEELFVLATYTNLFAYVKLLRQAGKEENRNVPQNLSSVS